MNYNHMYDNGVVVEDTASKHGGKKCLIIFDAIGENNVSLLFDSDILNTNLRQLIEEDFLR